MERMPDFCLLQNREAWGRPLVLDLETFLVGTAYSLDYREKDAIERQLEDMANDRVTAAKVPGHTIFLTLKYNFSGEEYDRAEILASLRGMADFYYTEVVDRHRANFARYRDGYVPELDDTWHPLTPEQLAEKKARKAARKAAKEDWDNE